VSTLATVLAGIFVFKDLPSVVDAFFAPRILIYVAPARRPAPASQTFIFIYAQFARPCPDLAVVRTYLVSALVRFRVPG
jgi:hypothetical protein